MTEAKSERMVVISGATKGLGRALALEFARNGYQVIGLYHSDHAAAIEVRSQFLAEELSGTSDSRTYTTKTLRRLSRSLIAEGHNSHSQ